MYNIYSLETEDKNQLVNTSTLFFPVVVELLFVSHFPLCFLNRAYRTFKVVVTS